jgi:hypothetical protein
VVAAANPNPITLQASQAPSAGYQKALPIPDMKARVESPKAEVAKVQPEAKTVPTKAAAPVSKSTPTPTPTPIATPAAAPAAVTSFDPHDLVNRIKGSAKLKGTEFNTELKSIFAIFKAGADSIKGSEISKNLTDLKDIIIEKIGTSLALFDISKAVREYQRVDCVLNPAQASSLKERIDNWVSRLIK